jgi:hypothetical protein
MPFGIIYKCINRLSEGIFPASLIKISSCLSTWHVCVRRLPSCCCAAIGDCGGLRCQLGRSEGLTSRLPACLSLIFLEVSRAGCLPRKYLLLLMLLGRSDMQD